MKRRLIKISLAIFAVAAMILGSLLAVTPKLGPKMTFGFLDGRTMTSRIGTHASQSSERIAREVYSFQADFNDVAAKADRELSGWGFRQSWPMGPDLPTLQYWLANRSDKRITVYIRSGVRLATRSGSGRSKSSPPDRCAYRREEGWVSVDIYYVYYVRLGPWQRLLNSLRSALRRATGK